MKKVLAVLAVLVLAQAAYAKQWFVGGAVGFESVSDAYTEVTLMPEVGYSLSDKIDVGLDAGFETSSYDDKYAGSPYKSETTIRIAPFARYNFYQIGKLNFLIKSGLGLEFVSAKAKGASKSESGTIFGIYAYPVTTYDISESVSLFANLNFLSFGLQSGSGDLYDYTQFGFGVDADDVLNTKDFQIGFVVKF
ncbi:MAG: outer membrane beta-barrel protein [Endomicrobia bacterium]|nr:outer membrane beta-barrel protein [Endomicrobiia bacterium]